MKKNIERSSGVVAALLSALLLAGCFGDSTQDLIASAKSHLDKNDGKAALIQLKNVLQKEPNSAEARFLMAKVLLQNGDAAGAVIELGKAVELGWDRSQIAPVRARALLLQGQPGRVVGDYAQTNLADAKAQAELKITLAAAYLGIGNAEAARTAIEAALKADPDSGPAQLFVINLLAVEKGRDEALQAVEALLAKKPQFVQAWLVKAELLSQRTPPDPAKALAAYEEAAKLDKSNVAALSGMFRLQAAKGETAAAQATLKRLQTLAPQSMQVRYYTVQSALQSNDLKAAQESAQAMLKAAPNHPLALHLAGTVALRRNELAQAEAHFKQALQAAPQFVQSRLLLARTYVRGGDTKRALSSIEGLIEGADAHPEALRLAAEIQLQQGEYRQAEALFARAVQANPKDTRSRTALAVAHIGKGQGEQGLDELRAISTDDQGGISDMALVAALMMRKDFDQALRAVDALERKLPGQPVAATLRGRVELMRGNAAKARQAFAQALQIAPTHVPALAALAAMDMAEKKPEDALKRYEQALEKSPQSLPLHMGLLELRARTGANHEALLAQLGKSIKQLPQAVPLRQALVRLHLERKDAKQAVASARDGVAAMPDNAEMQGVLALAHQAAGELDQALAAANKAVSLQPEAPAHLLRLAELQVGRKDNDAAAQTVKRVLALRPDLVQAQSLYATLLRDAGRLAEARSYVRGLQTQQPKGASAFLIEGDLEYGQRSWAAAAAAYRKALERQADTNVAIKLAVALRADGKLEDAKRHEAQWLARNPADAPFVFFLGDQALSRQDYGVALERYKRVLELRPDNAIAANNVAWLLDKTGKPGALEYARKANALWPKYAPFLDTLAGILANGGKMDEALAAEQEAVALDPGFHPHRLNLADLLLRAGKKAEAADQLKQLAALGDKFPRQDEVKRLQAKL